MKTIVGGRVLKVVKERSALNSVLQVRPAPQHQDTFIVRCWRAPWNGGARRERSSIGLPCDRFDDMAFRNPATGAAVKCLREFVSKGLECANLPVDLSKMVAGH